MRRERVRNVREIYEVSLPKVSPTNRSEGDILHKCGSFDMANESMNSAKPGSSYMPPKPLLLPRMMRASGGLSDEVPREKVVVQRLGGGEDALSPVSCVTSGRYHSSSETSNGESACSIQWSSAEDEVIEAKMKEPTASKDVDMAMEVGGLQIPLEEHGLRMAWFKESKQSEASTGYFIDEATSSKGQPSGKQVGSPETKKAALQVDDLVRTKGNPAMKLRLADDATCSNQEGDTDKLPPILEPTGREPSSRCQPLEQSEGSDHLFDVKVCDTCGDVGREHLLASCSKCSDGAEHIYCMRVKLDKVPEGCWICEDCKLEEEKRIEEKQKQQQDVEPELNEALITKLMTTTGNSGSFGCKNLLNPKGLAVGSSRISENLPSCYSAKRPLSSLVATPTAGKEGIKTSGMPSKLTSSSRPTVLPNSTTFKRRTMNHQGSIHRSESSGKVKRPEKFPPECGAVNNIRSIRDNRIKTLRKSALLNSSEPRYARNSNFRNLSLKLSDAEELKRFEHHSDKSIVRSTNQLVEATPPARLPATNGRASSSTLSLEIQQESERRILSGSKLKSSSSPAVEIGDSDLRIEGQKKTVAVDLQRTSYTIEAAEHGDTDLLNEDQNKVAGVNLETTSKSTEAARATKTTNSVTPLPLRDLPHAIGLTSSMSGMSAIPESNCVWKGGFLIQKEGRPLGTLGAVQAHLPTWATQPVLQILHEFPLTILLEKVARINKWSTQLLEEHAEKDNAVLFSLPKDLKSFERNNEDLSDCLVADDVCLKGDIGGFELLIFSSNLLQDRSQSWKKLFPLWGVLKKRTSNHSLDLLPPREGVQSHTFSLAVANSQNSKSSVLSSGNTSCSGTSIIVDMEANPSPSSTATFLPPVGAMKFYTRGKKSLHLPLLSKTDSLSWHRQLLGKSYSSQGDSTVSKRRREINLNKEKCSNGGWFAEEPEEKRVRTSKETLNYLGFNHADVLANGSGPNLADEWTSGWPASSGPDIPNLELSLRTPEIAAKPRQSYHDLAMRGCKDDGAWLSLSLSLPSSGKEQLERGPAQTIDIDTSLSLSCGLGH